ncbi:hypothetical protein D3C81_884610 [compost metagenome]
MIDFPFWMKGERHFLPFHMLSEAARHTLDEIRDNPYCASAYALKISTMLLSAIAIEALVNSVGLYKVSDWRKHKRKSPFQKLELITKALDIDFSNKDSLWHDARYLIKFRNEIVHAEPIKLPINKEIMEENFLDILDPAPSKIEEKITLENAEKAYEIIEDLKSLLCSKMDAEEDSHFFVPH